MKKTGVRRQKIERQSDRATVIAALISWCTIALFLLLTAAIANAEKVQITGIEIADYTLTIRTDGPIKHKVSQTADPFRVIVDIQGAGIGRFKEKILSKSHGITEITPRQMKTPLTARLDILLQAPSDVRSEAKDNMLILHIEKERRAQQDSSKVREAREITAVLFNRTEEGIEFIIRGNGIMPEPVVSETDSMVIIDIPDVILKASLPSKIMYPVKDIRHKAEIGRARFILEMEGRAEAAVFALDNEVIADIAFKQKSTEQQSSRAAEQKSEVRTPNLVSLDFQDADIVAILMLLGEVGGYNIVVHPDVKGKMSMRLLNVHWEQALGIILKTQGLEKIVEDNVIRVLTLKAYQEEIKAKEIGVIEAVATKVFVVNYASVDKVKDSIEKAKILSPRGNISTDTRTRSIIVKDTLSIHGEIQKLISVIDQPAQQVLIEARIVEVNSDFTKDLGVDWGLKAGNRVLAQGSASGTVPGGRSHSLINLPAGTAANPLTSAITLGYLNAAGTFGLDLRLSAVESSGKGKIISNPKVVTTDNQKAKILLGESIPYGEVTPGTPPTITTKFKDVALIIEVTPQVTSDDSVLLNVSTTKEDLVRFENIGGGVQAPRTSKIEGNTNVLVKDGETMVIGGIYKKTEENTVSGVTGLMNMPVLGWFFKRKTTEDATREVLIFITPRIVKQ